MKKLLIGILALTSFVAISQQEAMYTHYAFNTLAVNPGYAGSRDALTVTGLHRSQWVGFDGAPTTQTITMHAPLLDNKLGAGLSIVNDKIGPLNTTSLYGDFAYKLPISDKGTLSFGLKGGINIMQGTITSLASNDENDVALTNNIQSKILPNFGFGMYYSTTKWYVGLSTPKLLENNFTTNTTSGSIDGNRERRHYYLIGGAVFNLNESGSLKIKPSTFVKVTQGAPVELDLTGMLIIQDKIEAGLMFRTGDALGLLLGYNFSPQLRFGYSFDWSYNNTTFKYNGGSHEVMLRYDFLWGRKSRVMSPRYF